MSFEQLFDESYERVLKRELDGKDFFAAFYDHFLLQSPEIREKFVNTEMVKQRSMLKKSFYRLLVFYGSNHADDYLKKVAQQHDRAHFNVRPQLYDVWMDSLVHTVAQYDEQFTPETELAWRLVLTPGITYMKFLYDHSL